MKKGQQTRELILEAAKAEFRDMGYLNASIKGIAQRAGAQPSLLSYHYKNLDNIIEVVNREFHTKIRTQLNESSIEDPLILLFAYDLLVNVSTHCNPDSRRFKCESSMSNKVSMYAISSGSNGGLGIDDNFYMEILRKNHTTLPMHILYMLRIQESAARRELFIKYYSQDTFKRSEDEWFHLSVDISYCTITTVFRFSGIPNEKIDKCFNEAFAIVSGIDLEDVKML